MKLDHGEAHHPTGQGWLALFAGSSLCRSEHINVWAYKDCCSDALATHVAHVFKLHMTKPHHSHVAQSINVYYSMANADTAPCFRVLYA